MFWWPAYRLTGLTKAAAAVISLATAGVLIPLAPQALKLRSPAELQHEIVQRRRTELELRQVHAQLEGVIELRTAELAAKNEEMEQFLNTVSHDLKSPVVTCLGLAGVLREDLQAGRVEQTKDTINRIERSMTRMRQLIEDLLNLSRIGKVRFELTDVDTNSVIRSIGEEFKPRLQKIGATLEIESNLPMVRADAHWLTEVFENLITNAMKYGCDNPTRASPLEQSATRKSIESLYETTATESIPLITPRFSSRSGACEPTRKAAAWVWRSSSALSRCTAADSGSNPNPDKVQPSGSPCRHKLGTNQSMINSQ